MHSPTGVSRVEQLVHHALEAETGKAISANNIDKVHREWRAKPQPRTLINIHYKNFLALVTEDVSLPIGVFGRVANALEVMATPVALRIAARCGEADQRRMFAALASYLIRREACGLPTKAYSSIFRALLAELHKKDCTAAVLEGYLLSLTGKASVWPDDDDFRLALLQPAIYREGSASGLHRLLLTTVAATTGGAAVLAGVRTKTQFHRQSELIADLALEAWPRPERHTKQPTSKRPAVGRHSRYDHDHSASALRRA